MSNRTSVNVGYEVIGYQLADNPTATEAIKKLPDDNTAFFIGYITTNKEYRRWSSATGSWTTIADIGAQVGGDLDTNANAGTLSYSLDGDTTKLIASFSRGWVVWSNDSGATWSGIRHSSNSTITTSFLALRNGGNMFYSLTSAIQMSSTNGGSSWNELNIGTTKSINNAYITSTPYFCVLEQGGILYTSSDGTSWTARTDRNVTNGLIMVNDSVGYRFGSPIIGAGIYKTTDGWASDSVIALNSTTGLYPTVRTKSISGVDKRNSSTLLCFPAVSDQYVNSYIFSISSDAFVNTLATVDAETVNNPNFLNGARTCATNIMVGYSSAAQIFYSRNYRNWTALSLPANMSTSINSNTEDSSIRMPFLCY